MPEGKPKFQQQETINPREFPHTVTPRGDIYDNTSLEQAVAQGSLTPINAFVDAEGKIHINPSQYAPADANYREGTPNNIPTGQSEQYSHVPAKNPGLWLKDASEGEKGWGRLTGKSKVAIAGAAVALVVTGYGAKQVLDAKSFVNELADANNDRGISAPLVPGEEITPALIGDYNGDGIVTSEEYDMMPPTEYATLSDKVRVEDSAANLNTYLPTAWTTIQKNGMLTSAESEVLRMPNTSAPRSEWTDQDYYNNYTLGLWLVSNQGSTQDKINEGKRALSVVLSPNHAGFSDTAARIGETGARKNVYQSVADQPGVELTQGTVIDNVTIDSAGGRLTKGRFLTDGEVSYDLFVNRMDSNGNIVSILERSFPSKPAITEGK